MAKVMVVYAPDENQLEQILQTIVETNALKHKTISTISGNGANVVFLTSPEELTPELLRTSRLVILPITDLKDLPRVNRPLVITYKPPTVQINLGKEYKTLTTANKRALLNELSQIIQQFLGETYE